jgi:GH15 family glucan-1,4-alpha-glucosidase
MSEAKSSQATSSRARSPFPPIAEYAFLSDCHTGALLAADGSVDWLCVPRFDAPSVFGNLLDRGAGSFRFGPYGVNVPTDRVYNPGTNVVATAWHSGDGWLLVQEALILGPRTRQDRVTPHTRPPMDDDAAHMLVRVVECLDGEAEFELVCEPMFDYGRTVGQWTVVDDEGHVAEVTGADLTLRLASDMAMGVEGGTARARHTLRKGERAFCALSWAEDLTVPADADEAYALIRQTVTFWRSWLARARIPDQHLI